MAEFNDFDKIEALIKSGEEVILPCIPMRGLVVLPGQTMNFDMGRKKSIYSAKKALSGNGLALIITQRDTAVEKPTIGDLYEMGTVAIVKQIVATNSGIYRCLIEGVCRAEIKALNSGGNGNTATAVLRAPYEEETASEAQLEALKRQLREEFSGIVDQIAGDIPNDIIDDVLSSEDPRDLYEAIAFNIPADYREKQQLLEIDTLGEKLERLLILLAKEKDILDLEIRIHETVQNAVNQNQRDFYIREQIRALQEELGENPDMMGDADEIEDYRRRIADIDNISEDARAKLNDELDKLSKMPSYSQEAALVRNYLDTCLSLPWDSFDEETADVENAEKILDEDHYGIRKVKERVLENIAVRALTPDVRGQIICLYGPPGTGKTSVAKSIARALGRKYVRVSLGGVRDESDIRGHRKTYIGAMPGRIIAGMKQAGVMNPVMLLDEIDKMSNDFRGDPSSALLEALDSEQNTQFVDHYIEVPFDLSRVLFITTANSLETIQPPLLDRMEVIELTSYTREEKFHIAKEHLVPKQMKKYGLKTSQMKVNDTAIYSMIDSYTREAGVRKLEREIAKLCRKTAKELVGGASKVSFKAANIEDYLGHKKYTEDFYIKKPSVGCVNGLAWTSVGGVIMPLEALVLDGKGKIELTGSLGDVMKESAKLAVSNARRLADRYGIEPDFYEKKDIHIHAPEGATPKDGPSAGVTMITALVSALSGIPVRSDIAMTGEITLTGRVLPIGGLKEKSMAAYKAGVKTVLIPSANVGDLSEIDDEVRAGMDFITVEKIDDVLEAALVKPKPLSGDPPLPPRSRSRKPRVTEQAKSV